MSTSQMQARRSQPAVSTWFTFSLKEDNSNYYDDDDVDDDNDDDDDDDDDDADDDDKKGPAVLQPANPQRSPPHCDSPTTCREKSVLSYVEDFPGLPF